MHNGERMGRIAIIGKNSAEYIEKIIDVWNDIVGLSNSIRSAY